MGVALHGETQGVLVRAMRMSDVLVDHYERAIPTPRMWVPYVDLGAQHGAISAEIMRTVEKVLARGDFVLGREVVAFEERFAALCGVPFAVAVNSGTDALVLALRALEIGPGDEVITVPNSFVATTAAIVMAGATPRFVDVGDDYNMDPGQLEAAISARTKAIIPVHLTGRPADMAAIMAVARVHDLAVVEDAAQAVLAEYGGACVGSIGSIGCFSLHPLKTLGACGDAGVLTTRDEELYERLTLLRNLGLRSRDDCVLWSSNSRLDTLQAAILLVKMRYVHEWTARRRAHAARYREALGDLPGLELPTDKPHESAVYHTFVIQADRRGELRQCLDAHGVGTAIHYPVPIHLQRAARHLGYGPGAFPVAERQAGRILSLPVSPELRSEELDYVSSVIRRFWLRG